MASDGSHVTGHRHWWVEIPKHESLMQCNHCGVRISIATPVDERDRAAKDAEKRRQIPGRLDKRPAGK